MSALDKLLFSVAEELARGAKQAMPPAQWRKYLSPGRVLKRGGVDFPLRKDEMEYGAVRRALDALERENPDAAIDPNVFARHIRDFSDISYNPKMVTLDNDRYGMRYSNRYQLPGEKFGEAEELTTIPGLEYKSPHFDSLGQGLLSWSRTTRRPVLESGIPRRSVADIDAEMDHHITDENYSDTDAWKARHSELQAERNASQYGPTAQNIEEVQADLHQEGRDKGYRQPWSDKEYDRLWELKRKEDTWTPEEAEEYKALGEQYNRSDTSLPPPAPYRDTYHELELKKNIARAIEQGDDYVTWTTGEQQAQRWGQALRDRVDTIHYVRNKDGTYSLKLNKDGEYVNIQEGNLENLKPEQLEDMVGREIADKIKAGEGKAQPLSDEEHQELNAMLKDKESILDEIRALQDRIAAGQEAFRSFKFPPPEDPTRAAVLAQRNAKLEETANLINRNNKLMKELESMRSNNRLNDLQRRYNANAVGQGTISGDNIVVGGAGMRMNYDRKMVQAAEKLSKMYGGEGVTKVKIPGPERVDEASRQNLSRRMIDLSNIDPGDYDNYNIHEENIVEELIHKYGEDWENSEMGEALNDVHVAFGDMSHAYENNLDMNEVVRNWKASVSRLKNQVDSLMVSPSDHEVWALRLSPEMKERIKKAGLSLFAVPPVAAGLSSAEEPRSYAEGGPVFKDYGDVSFDRRLEKFMDDRHSSAEEQALAREYSHWPDDMGELPPLTGPMFDSRQWDLPRDDWGDERLAGMTPSQVYELVASIKMDMDKEAREKWLEELPLRMGSSRPVEEKPSWGLFGTDVLKDMPQQYQDYYDMAELTGIPEVMSYFTRPYLGDVAEGESFHPWYSKEDAQRLASGEMPMDEMTGRELGAFGETALNTAPLAVLGFLKRLPGVKKGVATGLGGLFLSGDRAAPVVEAPALAGEALPAPPTYVDQFNDWLTDQGYAEGGEVKTQQAVHGFNNLGALKKCIRPSDGRPAPCITKRPGYALGGSALEKLPGPARAAHQRLYDLALSAPETAPEEVMSLEGPEVAAPGLSRTLDTVLAGRRASSTGPTEAPVLPIPGPTEAPVLPIPGPVIEENPDSSFEDLINSVWSSDMSGLDPNARELIFKYEGMNHPYIWPGGVSGITLGRGYDLGHHSLEEFKRDWGPYLKPEQLELLSQAIGKTGPEAQALAKKFIGIDVDEDAAAKVFDEVSAPKYIELARTTFPGFDELPPNAQGALVSLVYNRGGSLKGASRVDMREIHDILKDGVQQGDLERIAHELRDMKRLWKNKGLDGLLARRDAEADLISPPKPSSSS